MDKLFGTDGIRAKAGEFPLDLATVEVIGAAAAEAFRARTGREPRFITGRDTRESGVAIEAVFHAGAHRGGAACDSAGVITTPGVAYLANAFEYDAGIVISASHNPYQDNGLKIFLPTGLKIDEELETVIEQRVRETAVPNGVDASPDPPTDAVKRIAYSMHLHSQAEKIASQDLKIVVDTANGAASKFAANVFKKAVREVIVINDRPDGRNINEACGSLHLDKLKDAVIAEKADLGVAFDGDADRALFVDENGEVVDGDATLWILAGHLQDKGKLPNSTVVATVMSNIGLERAFATREIKLLRTDVGDKYVLAKLIETGSAIGGEQSGHIILPELSLVGDGMMTALLMINAIVERGVTLSQAAAGFTAYPQILLGVSVKQKIPFESVPLVAEAAREIHNELGTNGRLLLRYSGTENLARIMIEGEVQQTISRQANHLADCIRRVLG